MTAYEIIMIVLGILGLMCTFCGSIIALLTYIDRNNKRK